MEVRGQPQELAISFPLCLVLVTTDASLMSQGLATEILLSLPPTSLQESWVFRHMLLCLASRGFWGT